MQEKSVDAIPPIDTSGTPAVFYANHFLVVCYKISASGGNGFAVLHFDLVRFFSLESISVESLKKFYPNASPWAATQCNTDCKQLSQFQKEWIISFNDLVLNFSFQSLSSLKVQHEVKSEGEALRSYLCQL